MVDFQIDVDGRVVYVEKAPHDVLCQDHINIELLQARPLADLLRIDIH